jgi:hypothetical protein
MGSITVNIFKPLVGTPDGGVTTGSVWPEEEVTPTADEVDGALVEEYAVGLESREQPTGTEVKRSARHRENETHVITGTLGLFVIKDHFQDGCECPLGNGGTTMRQTRKTGLLYDPLRGQCRYVICDSYGATRSARLQCAVAVYERR